MSWGLGISRQAIGDRKYEIRDTSESSGERR